MGIQTAERVSQTDLSDNYVYQRSLLAYVEASKIVTGDVLEIGTGSGYGIEVIAPKVNRFVTIDKFQSDLNNAATKEKFPNVEFLQMNVPPFTDVPSDSFDFVITFQVIEHIQDDERFVAEIHRVLRKGGKLILTTPNKPMSITRNPWHIREYTVDELYKLLGKRFAAVEKLGVFGNEKIWEYYEKNKASVARITRFDIFNLQYRLPRWMLQIPYDYLNRRNRRKLLTEDQSLVSDIKMDDYFMDSADEKCFDLFYVAEK